MKEGTRKKAVEGMMEAIRTKVRVKEIRRIAGDREKEKEMIIIKLENEEERKEILEKQRNLKGKKERNMEDWTWKERRMRWKLEEIAGKEEREGRRTWKENMVREDKDKENLVEMGREEGGVKGRKG